MHLTPLCLHPGATPGHGLSTAAQYSFLCYLHLSKLSLVSIEEGDRLLFDSWVQHLVLSVRCWDTGGSSCCGCSSKQRPGTRLVPKAIQKMLGGKLSLLLPPKLNFTHFDLILLPTAVQKDSLLLLPVVFPIFEHRSLSQHLSFWNCIPSSSPFSSSG